MRLALCLTGAAVALAGCIEANLIECPNGTVCAADKVCDTIHDTCVDTEQVSACDNQPERAECTWSEGEGKCFDGVCLVPGCGNTIIEPELGEACDDGNTQSLDDCSADCASTEICGNGVVDLLKDEACDDANLRSHDGCDSRCQVEAPVFTVTGVGIPAGEPGHGAFDEKRQKLVHFGDGLTWEFDGTAWAVKATGGVPADADWLELVYDATRERVAIVGGTGSVPGIKPIDIYLEWDGSAWIARQSIGLAQAAKGIATYDRAGKRIVIYAETLMWQLASETATWSAIDPPPTIPNREHCTNIRPAFGGRAIGYDQARAKVVLVHGGFQPEDVLEDPDGDGPEPPVAVDQPAIQPVTWELAGTTWECFDNAPFKAAAGAVPQFLGAPTLVWNGTNLVALGGSLFTQVLNGTDTLVFSGQVHELIDNGNGTRTWSPSTTLLPNPSANLEVAHDPAGKIYALGNLGANDDLFQRVGNGNFTAVATTDPYARGNAITAFDVERGKLVLLQGDNAAETWTWDDTWTQLAPAASPPLLPGTTMTYNPDLEAVVLLDQDLKTYSFDGTTWTQLGGDGVVFPGAMTFDPSRQGVLALAANGLNLLDADMNWVPIGPLPPQVVDSIAFDARNDVIVAMGAVDGRVFTFDGTSWQPTLTPGDASYVVVADQRRGSLDFVSPTGTLWERVGDNFTEFPALPVRVTGTPHYDPVRGRLVIFGKVGKSRVVVTRQLVGETPDELCDGSDADGDGKTGCDDDDCFWSCTADCPPFSSCP